MKADSISPPLRTALSQKSTSQAVESPAAESQKVSGDLPAAKAAIGGPLQRFHGAPAQYQTAVQKLLGQGKVSDRDFSDLGAGYEHAIRTLTNAPKGDHLPVDSGAASAASGGQTDVPKGADEPQAETPSVGKKSLLGDAIDLLFFG